MRAPATAGSGQPIKVVQASGHYDGDVAAIERVINAVKTQGASVIGHTESWGKEHRRVQIFDGGTWDYYRGQGAGTNGREHVIQWDTRTWQRVASFTEVLSDMTYRRAGTGRETPEFTAAVSVLRHLDTGRLVAYVEVHMPVPNTPHRMRVWLDCSAGLRRLTRDIRKRFPGVSVVIMGDFNRSARRRDTFAQVEKNIAAPVGLRQAWKGRQKGGYSSLISGVLTDLRVLDVDELEKNRRASDHARVMHELRLP